MEKIFYIAQLLGAISTISVVLIAISILAFIFLVVWYFSEGYYDPADFEEDDAKVCKKWIRTSLIVTIIATLISIFTPSKQTYLFMVGGHALEEIANNEKVQERASHTIDLLDQYLENKVKDSGKE
jgi:formate hydrogenlyase subunit 3/multisubunit Na+/H+ antiporter MnhD subunit